MNSDTEKPIEPLPGYRLIQKIGVGGYGEVWRAEAPGGLEKAIKFVFGTEHEKRATHELKALQRIKELRHPFLLSLERIEIVRGRLVVVTELADESLKDRFEHHRGEGRAGIPREELLANLLEAADALDFMRDAYALQHLDIKPENLLLVAGHVKVADFGLVKDVEQSQASIIGGMTPLYSAPEVFRGQPSSHSDQYSLAILYQEMLTGSLPFAGATAAELTLQHLSDEPNLTALTGADRFVIARALSKNPQHRYLSCRQFITTLLKSDTSEESTGASFAARGDSAHGGGTAGASDQQSTATEVFDDDHAGPSSVPSGPMLVELPAGADTSVRKLGTVDFDPQHFRAAPTLFLGVGGAGNRVLMHLCRQLHDRFGDVSNVPIVRMLALDTDPKALMELSHEDSGLATEDTLALPLRRPQHYREQSSRLLKWLSRRWLYNIPKSMRTEGLRPLGRLALVDHARQACQRVRQSIMQAADPQSRQRTIEATGLPLAEQGCRVYLVASISGGTGSGMLLDLAYAVRAALERLELVDAHIFGILLHSTGRDPRIRDLARVNAYSWLNEYNHFVQPGQCYPGDHSCGLPAHAPGTKPFDHAYLLHVGEGLNTDDFNQAASAIANYLHLDALTPAQTFFDACRSSPADRPAATAQLRSFGLQRTSAAPGGMRDAFANLVSQRVLESWCGEPAPSDSRHGADSTQTPVAGAAALVARLRLDLPGMASNAQSLIEASLGGDLADFLHRRLAKHTGDDGLSDTVSTIDELFRRGEHAGELDASLTIANRQLSTIVQPLEEKLRTDVSRWITVRLDEPGQRLDGARGALQWLASHMHTVRSDAKQKMRHVMAQIVELRRPPGAEPTAEPPGDESPTVADDPLIYLTLRIEHCALLAAEHFASRILADCQTTTDQLTHLGRELKQMSRRAATAAEASAWESEPMSPDANTADQLQSHVGELASHVDRRVQAEYLNEHGGLMETIMHGGRPRAQLLSTLRDHAARAVDEALSQFNSLDHVISGSGANELEAQVQSAMPSLLEFGGAWRLLAVMPMSCQDPTGAARRVAESLGSETSTVVGCDNSFSLCVEAQDLSLAHVAVSLVHRRRDYVEFAERVRSRSDISWTKITDALPASSSQPDVPAGAAPVAAARGAPPATTTQVIT